jgi:lycopene cyclase domain-containing protein
LCLAVFWFVIDQIAVRLGLWSFPSIKESTFRVVSLPLEEYVMFFLHTVVCFIFLKHYTHGE